MVDSLPNALFLSVIKRGLVQKEGLTKKTIGFCTLLKYRCNRSEEEEIHSDLKHRRLSLNTNPSSNSMDIAGGLEAVPAPPHVLIFPFPLQGHINSMLKLAQLLCLAGVHVTFLVPERLRDRFLRHSNIQLRFPGFRLESISDGITAEAEQQRSGVEHLGDLFESLRTTVKPLFRELLISNRLSSETRRPVTCIIADGVLSFVLDLGEEMGIPVIYFRTASACYFWSVFCFPKLIEAGEIPFKGNDMDVPIENVPGMNGFLRRRDLPNICRLDYSGNSDFQFILTETQQTLRARGLILNTFEDLEGPIISHIRTRMPNLYTLGPLHALLKARLGTEIPPSSNCFWEEDRRCLTWLDARPPRSVIYLSFGSLTTIERDQLLEFWHGLVNSGKPFLWVIRPNLVSGGDQDNQIPATLLEGTKERGYMVGWAPQEEVLSHRAVGGFLTHSGWNSTLESIVAGVPMVCWPYFLDQKTNSRFVGEVWRLGLDMKDTCDRMTVERMINDLMNGKENEFVKSANRMAELAANASGEGGSSSRCLDRLTEDIRLMSDQHS